MRMRLGAFTVAVATVASGIASSAPVDLAPTYPRWAARYDGPGHSADLPQAQALSPDGTRLFVTGQSHGPDGTNDYVTVANDASSGRLLWSAHYDGPLGKDDFPTALVVSPDGNRIFVSGSSEGVGTGYDFATVAYDVNTGNQRWVTRYSRHPWWPSSEGAVDMATSPDGTKLYLTGRSTVVGAPDYTTLALEAATGGLLWEAHHGRMYGSEIAAALEVAPDGTTVYVTGSLADAATGEWDYLTIAYDAGSGTEKWITRHDDAGRFESAGFLVLSPDGATAYVLGNSTEYEGYSDFETVAYDTQSGIPRWVARHSGPVRGNDYARALGVSPDGSHVYIAGTTPAAQVGLGPTEFGDNSMMVAYSAASGAQAWVTTYGSARGHDEVRAIASSPEGDTVYVTGSTSDLVGGDATYGFDSESGDLVWAARYVALEPPSGLDDLRGIALAVSPDGSKVYVTGEGYTAESRTDFLTVAYCTHPLPITEAACG